MADNKEVGESFDDPTALKEENWAQMGPPGVNFLGIPWDDYPGALTSPLTKDSSPPNVESLVHNIIQGGTLCIENCLKLLVSPESLEFVQEYDTPSGK